MFTNYSFDVISTVSEWNEIAYGLNNGLIKWDFLERELHISNRESKHNYFYEEDMCFGMETKYSYVYDEVRNLSQLFPTAIIKCVSYFEGDYESYTFWYCNGDDQGHKSNAGKEREDVYSAEVMRFLTMDTNKSSGLRHKVELLPDGTVKAEGENIFGECDVSGWTDIQALSCGNWHTVGLKKDGTLVACGSNANGQCNVSDIEGKAVAVSCGRYHTAILLESGKVIIKGYLEDEVKNAKPLSPDSIPEICKLILSKTVKGWEKMNKLIEDISSGDELIIKPVIKDGGAASFEVCNSNGKKIGNLGGILRENYDDFATMLDKIKAYAEDVVPLSKKGPRAKYAAMNVRLQYIGSNEEISRSGKYKQTPVEKWPAVKTIKSVFDAVIGLAEDGQIFVSGFCPLTEEGIQMLINNELVEYFEKQNAINPINKTEIGNQEFSHCNRLRAIVIPDGVTSIGERAFYDCKYLESVIIPKSVTSIGSEAFEKCTKLKYVTILDSVISIEQGAFKECTSLTSVAIPDSVISIGYDAFGGTPFRENDEREFVIYGKVLCKYRGTQSSVAIPEGVKSIGENAFSNYSGLTDLIIPEGVTDIGNNAFINCSSLTSVIIPESVTDIGSSAFENCGNLNSITLPDSLNNIRSKAFCDCKGLADEKGFVIIKNVLYGYFGNNNSLIIPNNVTSIESCAFENCTRLTSITIPDSVTNIGFLAFASCTSLTSITISGKVTSIEPSAFENCNSLTSITIPDSVTNIGWSAFKNCTSLTSIIIPESVTSIGSYAFENCKSLTSIIIPESVTSIGSCAFENCKSLTSITIPDSVTNIGVSAFENCTSLTSITIPENVINIKRNIFRNSKRIKSLTVFAYTVDGTLIDWDKVQLSEIQSMLKSKDYSVKIEFSAKAQFAVQVFLKDRQPEAEAYIKKTISKILPFFIDIDDYDTVKGLLESGKFVTKKNIMKFINHAAEQAQSSGNIQIHTMLQKYKNEKFPDINE